MKRIINYVLMAGLILINWELYDTQDELRAVMQANGNSQNCGKKEEKQI
jgi:hypothetical protein